jgi:eukaryotic-like serine/threonine-protein kinase
VTFGSDPRVIAGVQPGDVLAGKYRVERVLGRGGMGVVVAAHHIQLDEKVALKFLLPEALGNAEAVARFAREARAAVKIKSEHVASVKDVGTLPNGAPYIVMEYLEGGDLATWLRQRGPLPIEQAVEFVLQACVAVADAHALGIVHRDLKPANLFCVRRSDGQLSIKVLDFGISKMTDTSSLASGSGTRTSALMGSPFYMSPEQMRSSRDVDAQTDIWALGVILFELMSGRPAFQAETVTELAIKVANERTPSVRGFRPDVPSALEAILFKCLEKDRRRRYRNVAELAVALLEFAPKRAKASVERIAGIVQAAGLSASALELPPSPQPAAETLRPPETVAPVGRTTLGTTGRKTLVVGAGLVGVVSLLAIVGAVNFLHRSHAHLENPPGASPKPATAAASPPAPTAELPPLATPKPVDALPVEVPPAIPIAAPPAAPPTPAVTTAPNKRVGAGPAVAASPVTSPASKPGTPAACKLVKTLDKNGEAHFSCPCASCQ